MLGKIINNHIDRQSITQEQFADSIGITSRMLRYIINGLKTPSVATLKRIAIVTNTSMDELTKDIK